MLDADVLTTVVFGCLTENSWISHPQPYSRPSIGSYSQQTLLCHFLLQTCRISAQHSHPYINRTVERIMRAPTRTTVNLVCTIVKTDDCQKVCTCTQFRFAHTPIVCDSGSYALRDSIPVSQKLLNIQRLKFLTIQLRIVRGIGFSSGLVVMGDFIRTNWNRCKLDYS